LITQPANVNKLKNIVLHQGLCLSNLANTRSKNQWSFNRNIIKD